MEVLPFGPWEPVAGCKRAILFCVFGCMVCERHQLVHENWTWELRDGSRLNDRVFISVGLGECQGDFVICPRSTGDDAHLTTPLSQRQVASREACIAVFEWVQASGEGKPPSESIYDDEWIAECIYDGGSELGMEDVAGNNVYLPTKSSSGGEWW
ncbi:uncharacterized protein BDW43DRAFT_312939 [Aspergillus alliaceus]|uniref:uncharacterized protein n=1 Tax=Petromyces alliaceus TaxID=209559 RepID=UPI0012A710C3|nr:uncharacterized protein BDW43DRAFT_312939 [Aspergillus alliaceus]KAB8231410.1 hypothetical protein BDW43DRAFT_312939 [Aspergillus alliaceus]